MESKTIIFMFKNNYFKYNNDYNKWKLNIRILMSAIHNFICIFFPCINTLLTPNSRSYIH